MAPAADPANVGTPVGTPVVHEGPWRDIAREVWRDLQPFPGRFGQTWRVALLCAIVAGVAMVFKVPEAAIGCYLVIFLARPSGAECVGQALGLIILVSVVVLAMAPVIELTADDPLLRIVVIAATSFAFVFLGAASQLGEIGSIIALVIGFVLTLVDQLPAGEIATRGLLYAWQMAVMPMVAMIVFNLVFGTSPHRLLRDQVCRRLNLAAAALVAPVARAPVDAALAEGLADGDQQLKLARLFHTTPTGVVDWLAGATASSYRLLLAVAALPADLAGEARARLAQRCGAAARAIAAGEKPLPDAGNGGGAAQAMADRALEGLSRADGGGAAAAPAAPFLGPDAFSNPDYQRYALKTTAAAISCYLIYSLIDWQGIHTAMVTCYVAALSTTAETVHKLALRICGCLVGAALGFGAILFVIPHLDSVGGLMALVFAGVLVGAWVSTGSERISYAGVQVGLAFLLTILTGFGPSLDMSSGRDRIVGILLGNVVVYLIFTTIWPKSAAVEVRARLRDALAGLSRLAAMPTAQRLDATADAAAVAVAAEKAEGALLFLPFEPSRQRPAPADVARLRQVAEQARSLLPAVVFAGDLPQQVAHRLSAVAEQVGAGPCTSLGAGAGADEGAAIGPAIDAGLQRLERLVG